MVEHTQTLENHSYKRTKAAILWTNILNEPFASLYPLTVFFLEKELHASPWQIVLFTMLKPMVSLFSFYWSASLSQGKHSLRLSLLGSGVLARLPFFLYPFIDSVWFFIFSAPLYMLFSRAGVPAWMEILKRNLPKKERERLFSFGSAIGYVEGVLLAIGFGVLLDSYSQSWKVLFFLSALVGLIGVYIQSRIPMTGQTTVVEKNETPETVKEQLIRPWKDSINLVRTRPDFAHFQWGFMLCGFSIMLIQPLLPFFVNDVLKLSFTELAIALSICKGLGFAFSSMFWARGLRFLAINTLSSLVFVCTALFPLLLISAPAGLFWVYFAYVMYGVAQGGSHLLWHMSGPLFAEAEDSSKYSGVNVVMVGIRGIVGPALGGVLGSFLSPIAVLAVSGCFSVYAGLRMLVNVPSRLKSPVSGDL